jgi:hypothetical protein
MKLEMNFLKTNNSFSATVNSTLNAPSISNAYMIYVVLIIVLVIVIIVTIYFTKDSILMFVNKIIMNTKEFISKLETFFKKHDDKDDDKENIIGNWCFVGEDLTGRFCVKVPSAELCPKSRAFPTRDECEMVKASPMPLTIQENNGTTAIPLAGLPSV